MRRRDLDQINPPQAWLDKAKAAQADIDKGLKRSKDASDIWAALKPDLSKLSCGKCWYCESRQARSDNAVDHFRPKSDYPWLACWYKNYRFACSFCNSPHRDEEEGVTKGKSNLFPRFEGSPQAKTETDIPTERPILLDPCNPADPGLLDFLADGTPCPKFPANRDFTRRVKESIKIYNLDHPELIEQRRVLGRKLQRWIEEADAAYKRFIEGDPTSQRFFESNVRDIAQALDDRAELSAFARRIVTFHRDKPWVETILDT